MRLRTVTFVASSWFAFVSCDPGSLRDTGDFTHRLDDTLRMNQLQALATHNSYHIRETPTSFPDWMYEHSPIGIQLADQGVRGLEIDIHWNEDTGSYDVLHLPLIDPGTTCPTFHDCLEQVRTFSDANPGHHPIFVQIELKWVDPNTIEDRHLDAIDAEILDVFPRKLLVTPRDVRGNAASLREAVTTTGWPTLGEARGRTMFLFNCDRVACLKYVGTDLDVGDRVIFPDSEDGDSWESIRIHNSVDAVVPTLVDRGLIVRVFADSMADVLMGMNDLDAALASGAQLLSTDVAAPRTDTNYVADIPGGTPSRCNPRIAPVGCVSTDVEDPALLRGR